MFFKMYAYRIQILIQRKSKTRRLPTGRGGKTAARPPALGGAEAPSSLPPRGACNKFVRLDSLARLSASRKKSTDI